MESRERADVLVRYRRRIREALPGRVSKVLLYGSRARGDASPDSDWDIAVFLSGDPPDREDRRVLADAAYDLIVESGEFIQPMVFPLGRWTEESQLMRDIRDQSVEI